MKNILFGLLLAANGLAAQVFNVVDFGAVGDSTTLNTAFIQKAIDSCHATGGGKVIIPKGIFLSGTLIMKSNVTLRIDSGGTLKGSANLAHYPVINPQLKTFTDSYVQRSLIYGENLENISFEGKGTVNGNGLSGIFINSNNRVYGFRIFSSKKVSYKDLNLVNSAFWMMHNCNIDTLTIQNLTITNHCFGNQDGINIDACRNVLIENCDVDGNNDPIVMKGTSLNWCENVEVRNCTLATYSRAIKIGTETQGWFRNIHVHDCVVKKSTRGPLGLDAKCGINLAIVDGGSMENVQIENVSFESVITPIMIRLGNQARPHTPSAPKPGVGFVRNLHLKNITATASSNITSSITGIPHHPVENILLENVSITVSGGFGQLPQGFVVPENENGKPEHDIFGDTLPAFGVFVRHVNNLQLCNVSITATAPDSRPQYVFENVSDLDSSCQGVNIIESAAQQADWKFYPNPAKTELYIVQADEKATTANIMDVSGKILSRFNLSDTDNEKINVSLLPSGCYILELSNGTKTKLLRFLKN